MTTEEHYPTQESVARELRNAGIVAYTGDWDEYERAKKLIFKGDTVNVDDYERKIKWIIEYCRV